MASTNSIELTKLLGASPERVYKALTDARMLERWFPSRVEADVRVGGKIRFFFEAVERRDDEEHLREGVFRELVPGRRVSYTFSLPEGETLVTWTLTPKGKGTELKLVHSGFRGGPGSEMGQHSSGWAFYVGNLSGVLDGEKDRRPEAMGQKTVK
jgi:uncharacterized protein YndB with AHSA1/START domain